MFHLIKNFNCALSIEYSALCKIFIFPMNATPSYWLEKKEIWVDSPSTDLLFLFVTKSSKSITEKKISPQKMTSSPLSYYKLFARSHVMEREVYTPKETQVSKPAHNNYLIKRTNKAPNPQTYEESLAKKNNSMIFQRASKIVLQQDVSTHNKPHHPNIFDELLMEETLGKRQLKSNGNTRESINQANNEDKPLADVPKRLVIADSRKNNFAGGYSYIALQTSKQNNQDLSLMDTTTLPVEPSKGNDKEYRHKMNGSLNRLPLRVNTSMSETKADMDRPAPVQERASLKSLIPVHPIHQEYKAYLGSFSPEKEEEENGSEEERYKGFNYQSKSMRSAINQIYCGSTGLENQSYGLPTTLHGGLY